MRRVDYVLTRNEAQGRQALAKLLKGYTAFEAGQRCSYTETGAVAKGEMPGHLLVGVVKHFRVGENRLVVIG